MNNNKLLLASNNQGKMNEIKAVLPQYEILTLKDLNIDSEPEENALSFEENALIKARDAKKYTDYKVIADDSGLEVYGLNMLPGVYSKRLYNYINQNTVNKVPKKYIDRYNNEALLKLIDRIDNRPIQARFVTVIALIEEDGSEKLFKGICKGHIVRKPQGERGFGYDPIFQPLGFEKTFAQLSDLEKNSISHRAMAIIKLKEYLNA